MIIVTGHFTIAPEQAEAARPLFLEMMQATRAEEGCVEYRFTADLEVPGRFSILEIWQDEAALHAHFATPHMATFRAQVSSFSLLDRSLVRHTVTALNAMG